MKKSRLLLLLIPCFFFLIVCFHKPLVCFGLKGVFSKQLVFLKGATVSYGHIGYSKGCVYLDEISFLDPHSDQQRLHIDRLECLFSFKILPFTCHTSYKVVKPSIKWDSSIQRKSWKDGHLYDLLSLHPILKKLTIEKGKIECIKNALSTVIYLSFEPCKENKQYGSLSIGLGKDHSESRHVDVNLYKGYKEVLIQAQFNEMPLQDLFAFLSPEDSFFKAECGVLQGDIHLGVTSKNTIHYFKSDLEVREMAVRYYPSNSMLQLDHCKFHSYLPLDRQDKIELSQLSTPLLMKYLVSTLALEGGKASFRNPHSHCVWQLGRVEGVMTFNLEQAPSLYLKGDLEKDNSSYPFTIQGKGLMQSEDNWWMDLDLCMPSEGENTFSHTSIYLALLKQKEYFIQTALDKLRTAQLLMLQDLCLIWCPELEAFHLSKGSLSTHVTMQIQEKKIESLSFESLVCSDFQGEWRGRELQFECADVKGRIKLHFPLLKGAQASSWDIAFQDLVARRGKENILLESSGFFSSKEGRINSSWIKTKLEGIEGECSVNGPYSQLEFAGTFLFGEKHLLSQFQQEVLSVNPSVQALEKMDFSFKIKQEKKGWGVGGTTHLKYSKEGLDKIRFGFELCQNQSSKIPALKEGWFQSDKLSENTYLWLLKHYKQKWSVLGDMKVTGEFNLEGIEFSLESQEALYDSEDILVKMPFNGTLYKGDFFFDLSKKSWLIHLPIIHAQCTDKRLHLPFEEVSADVKIEGMELAAENIQALCEKVAFTGRLDLDFTDPEWIDLKLYPKTMRGEASDFITFMHYLPDFETFNLPLKGKIEGREGNYLFTRYNLKESKRNSKIAFAVYNAECEVNPSCKIKEMNFDLIWDSTNNYLEIKDLQGQVLFCKEEEERQYRLNAQNLISRNISQGEWDFDVRVEAPTFDVFRIAGKMKREKEDFQVFLEPNLTHFFGAKLVVNNFTLTSSYAIKTLQLRSEISSVDLLNQLQCGYLSGFLDLKPSFFQEIKNTKTSGDITLGLSYNIEDGGGHLEVESSSLIFDQLVIADFSLKAFKNSQRFSLEKLQTKDFSMYARAEKIGDQWKIPALEMYWKNSLMTIKEGVYVEGRLELDLDHVGLALEEMEPYIPCDGISKTFLCGRLSAQGQVSLDFSQGLKKTLLASELTLSSESMSLANLEMVAKTPFKLFYSHPEGLRFENLILHVKKEELEEAWTKIDLRELKVSPYEKTAVGKGIKVTLPPEMLLYLGDTKMLPHVEVEGKELVVFGTTIVWDNQIETELDFVYSNESLQVQGILKDGYYWVGDKSLYLQKFHYFFDQDQLNLLFGCDYLDISLDLLTKIQCKEDLEAKITLKEGHIEGMDERSALELVCRYSKEEGFYLQNIEGEIYGIDFSFRRNPRSSSPDGMVLTGQMKIDSAGLVKAFPKLFYQTMKDLGMGSGYELSGDWIFSKKDLKKSSFKGFLKGRDFEFLGFYFKTLLSEVEMDSAGIIVRDFSLSDVSGVAQMKEARVQKSEEDGSWKLMIPEIAVQDFRPSFLKKNNGQEERIKPFVIKDLHFFNIEGTLGYKDSFSGKGHLNFINTFKRETNLLDIPIEIIGRIGFDLGLFVPVVGKLDFEMTEGKIFLREMKSTYSEGKRSKFYLSSRKDSYIGLDGSLFIDIKMKQYVLLKLTEPFILSIRGTLLKPRYSLR